MKTPNTLTNAEHEIFKLSQQFITSLWTIYSGTKQVPENLTEAAQRVSEMLVPEFVKESPVIEITVTNLDDLPTALEKFFSEFPVPSNTLTELGWRAVEDRIIANTIKELGLPPETDPFFKRENVKVPAPDLAFGNMFVEAVKELIGAQPVQKKEEDFSICEKKAEASYVDYKTVGAISTIKTVYGAHKVYKTEIEDLYTAVNADASKTYLIYAGEKAFEPSILGVRWSCGWYLSSSVPKKFAELQKKFVLSQEHDYCYVTSLKDYL